MTSIKCALYLRVSFDRTGEEMAVSRQRDECMKIIHDRGWELSEEYVDHSISASSKTTARPAYDRLVADYEAGKYAALVCWDLDRLTRQPRQLEDWIDAAEERGLKVVTANGEADLSTDGGRLFARIKASVARAEIERKSARQKAAHRQRVQQGKMWRGSRPFGYAADGRSLDPDEAEMVRLAARTMLEGGSLAQVARTWDAAGVRNTKYGDGPRPYSPTAIRKMLLNPHYAGRLVYLGEDRGEGDWEPIFDMSTHLALLKLLGDSSRNHGGARKGPKASTLLSGLFSCGRCGSTRGRAGTRKGLSLGNGELGPRRPTYFCPECEQFIERAPFETEVATRVVARLSQPDYLEGLVAAPGDNVTELQQALDALAARERELGEAFGRGAVPMSVVESGMTQIEAERIVLEAELQASVPVMAYEELAVGSAEVADQFESLPLGRQRGVIEATCRSIALWPRKLREQRIEVDLF